MIMECRAKNIILRSSNRKYFAILYCINIISFCSVAGEYFNPHLLETTETSATSVDLSWLSQESVPPGEYNLDVYINGSYLDPSIIVFKTVKTDSPDSSVQPCISLQQLKSWNIKTDENPVLSNAGSDCADLSAISGFDLQASLAQQRVDITVPQAAMLNRPRGFIPEKQWQEGITAALLNYSLSGQSSDSRKSGDNTSSQFLSLQPGLNFGRWRLRNYSTLTHDENGNKWESVYNTLSRDVAFLKGQLVIGQSYTSAGVFDSISFTGIQLTSDEEMRPDSMRGFAPVVRGVARSTAEVTIYQNGYSIYKTTVAPGAFEIADLYPTGSVGDLSVTVKESDGSQQSFIVPYASLAVLQRQGQLQFSASSGKSRSDGDGKEYNFIQSSAAYGILGNVTLYGGLQQAEDQYTNVLLGSGFNLGKVGALSVDLSQAWAKIRKNVDSDRTNTSGGQSLRVRFSKSFADTGTNFSVAGYRYSTSGYYSFQDFVNNSVPQDSNYGLSGRPRNRFDASISQFLNDYGSLSLSLVSESYWDSSRMDSLSLGYGNAWGTTSYFINYSWNRNVRASDNDGGTTSDKVLSLTVSIPLGNDVSAIYGFNGSQQGSTTHSVGLNGSAFKDRSLNWSAQEGYDVDNKSTSGNVNLDYQGAQGNIAVGYGYDNYSNNYNYALRGGMVLHSGGLTLSRPLGEQVALVEAPGVQGIAVRGQTNITTDRAGYAVVPYLRSYHENSLSLDEQLSNAEFDNVSKTVIPTHGAIVKVHYDTYVGYRTMMTLRFGGESVPFGAIVSVDDAGKEVADSRSNIVGDEGQVYLTGLDEKGELAVKWGNAANQQCRTKYDFSALKETEEIIFSEAECE